MSKLENLLDLGEYGLHNRILELLGNIKSSIWSPGDDACVVPINTDIGIAICTDIVPSEARGRYAGKFAVVHSYSDLLAVGALPKGILISLGVPGDLPLSEFDDIITAAAKEAIQYNTNLLGGDTKERTFYCVVATAIGIVPLDKAISRFGARKGDILAVTRKSNCGWGRRWAYRICKSELGEAAAITTFLAPYNELDLRLPYHEMLALADSGFITSGIDCTDGLAASCRLLANSSGVGVSVELENLKNMLAVETIQAAEELHIPPSTFCFTPGYDFECLLTIRKTGFDLACKIIEEKGGSLIRIGDVVDKGNVVLIVRGKERDLPPVGDMKFAVYSQYNTPKEWINFARSFEL